MAIITDPDNLDRKQVIYGTTDKWLSLYPCGALTDATATGTDGVTVNGTKNFTSATALFTTTNDVNAGDMLCIFTGPDSGHYVIDTVDSATQVTVLSANNFAPGGTTQVYEVREPTGGTIVDGVTEQCLYSFSKEEWRVDSETYGSDDLIRHPFVLELVTREQGEIGGGTKLGNWEFADIAGDDYTRKKIRTGGWSSYNSSSVLQNTWTGFKSLGSLDSDAQPYFQQTNATTTPVNFEFTGVINEAVETHDGATPDNTYFKAFCRKKFRDYTQYNLLDEQGLTVLENILYAFPLSHSVDPAIVVRDSQIEGMTPYTNYSTTESGTDGVTTISTLTFTSATALFSSTNQVYPGDVLYIAGTGSDAGYYTVLTIVSDTELTLIDDTDDGITSTFFSGDTALTYEVHARQIIPDAIDGALADVDSATGTLTSVTGGFAGTVATGDMVIITEAASDHRGVYKVVSQDSDTVLTLNTSDKAFTTQSSIDFHVNEPGMYIQGKEDTVTLSATGNLTFADADPDTITRTTNSWITDGVVAGDVITITNSTNNNGSYTVASRTALVATLVASDTLTAEGPVAATATCKRYFARSIQGVTYAFKWRLFGNDAELSDIFQYHQKMLREPEDVDDGPDVNRGDITDLLMTFVSPNAVTTSMYIDDLNSADSNSITYYDVTTISRLEAYVAAGNMTFNSNLQNDASAIYHMFFLNDDAGNNSGYDYGTENAITVKDSSSTDIKGNVSGLTTKSFDYDYDGNIQRGAASAGNDAPIVLIAIGLATAQFFRFDGTITRAKGLTFALSSALERNYSNP